MKRELTCIGCPMGCQITVTMDGGEILTVEGNTCKIGENYARQEVTAPTRMVTSTVRVLGGKKPVVAVKTASAVPKDLIFQVMEELNGVSMKHPVHIGDVVLENVCGTGINIVATQNSR